MNLENTFRNLPTIKTERLILRRMKLSDAEDIFAYAFDEELTKTTNWSAHKTIQDSENYLRTMIKRYSYNQASEWCMVLRATGKVIGTCGFVSWVPKHYSGEIGYSIARKYWNMGLTTEAIRSVIDFGFNVVKLNRIEAKCKIHNIASERVMQKVGMQLEGIMREGMYVKDKFHSLKIYSILLKDYKQAEGKQ